MHAMVLNALHTPLEWTELPDRLPGPGQIRVKVAACGVCRTDLHVVDGELPNPHIPIIPGHEVVGRIDAIGTPLEWTDLPDRRPGAGAIRVAIAACGVCRTDLHVVDGELPHPQVPIIPGPV